ncbi:MAG: hypothetical protein JO051_06785 [Acidobacteriaceae bacterium]|nr:hypothetical protein [Acidobacteriaceae bacterium]
MKITPILFVEAIELCLPFWTEQLGFQKTVEVPEGDKIGFVILVHGESEVSLQTLSGRAADFKTDSQLGCGSSTLFIEVDDFDDLRKRVKSAPVIIPERITFYGMREIGVQEPGGHLLVFAAKEPMAEDPAAPRQA